MLFAEEYILCLSQWVTCVLMFVLAARSPVYSHLSDTMFGLTTIRVSGAQEMVRGGFDSRQVTVHIDLHMNNKTTAI
jgi:hypothetical protein